MEGKRPLVTRKKYLFQAYRFWKTNFDPKRGLFGGIFMGSIIFLINANHGFWLAFSAMGKQAVYTFCFGGIFVKLSENLSIKFKRRRFAYAMATLLPATLAIFMTYAVHSLKGTPEPFNSTLPAIITAPPAFAVWGWKTRNRWEKEELLRKKMARKHKKKKKSVTYTTVANHGRFTP